ncbi:hypothetical protein JCM11641_005256 [Rhodosporidiobolus odoratus]
MRPRSAAGGHGAAAGAGPPPSTSSSATPLSSPARKRSRISTFLLVFLQLLSVIPSLIGFFYSGHRFYSPHHLVFSSSTWVEHGTSVGITSARSTRLDWFISGMWALATAYFTFQLSRGLLRRWLVYYSMGPTIIRVISLQAICWPLTLTTHRVLSFDQPVAAWCVCATTAAISNVIQTWVTSNIVERKDRRGQQRWQIYSTVVTAVLGPGVRTDKYRKGERVVSWKRVLWGTVLPFALLSWSTSAALLCQQYSARYHGGGGVSLGTSAVDASVSSPTNVPCTRLPDLQASADIRILVLVSASWSDLSATNRRTFRSSTVELFPPSSASASVSVTHRFLLGTAPSPKTAVRAGSSIEAEAEEFGDVLMVPAHDRVEHESRKVWEGWKWASGLEVDYVVKTEDDVFLRMDVVAKELAQLGKREGYWRGFAFSDMPTMKDDYSYDLPTYPPYTSGALHILSKDLVDLVASSPASRLFTKNEAQNLGIWLHPYGIRPLHDARIQEGPVCENDLIAKRFHRDPLRSPGVGAREMYANVAKGRKQCEGTVQRYCGLCYPSCHRRENLPRHSAYTCDEVMGATLSSRSSSSAASLDVPVRVSPEPFVMGSQDDPWIIPGLLSQQSSAFSSTDRWHLLHFLFWVDPAETFLERHYQTLETILAHEPRALVVVLSTTLPLDFFDAFAEQGYTVHIVRVGKEQMMQHRWFGGKDSERWLKDWDKWEKGPHFASHLADYLRYLCIFRFGGTFHDFNIPSIRSPPDSRLEYVSSRLSALASDISWTLDEAGSHLAPDAMRFRRGWIIFRDVLESAFSAKYSPACLKCVGARAITSAFRARRLHLEQAGFVVLPPLSSQQSGTFDSHHLIRALPAGEARVELSSIIRDLWSIFLLGRMTDHLRIQPGSVIAETFDAFSLSIPRPIGRLSLSHDEPDPAVPANNGLRLRLPPSYTFRSRAAGQHDENPDAQLLGSLDGRFEGLDLIYLQGALPTASFPSSRARAEIRLSTSFGGGRIALLSAAAKVAGRAMNRDGEMGAASEIRLVVEDASLRDINAFLVGIVYVPPSSGGRAAREAMVDGLSIEVVWGGERVEGKVRVEVPPLPPGRPPLFFDV